MLDPRVRLRVDQGLVSVVVANEVRRTAVLAARLNNDCRVLLHPDHLALERRGIDEPLAGDDQVDLLDGIGQLQLLGDELEARPTGGS